MSLETEVTDAMIEAGIEARDKIHAAMRDRNLSDEPEDMPDYDEGDVMRAIYAAMTREDEVRETLELRLLAREAELEACFARVAELEALSNHRPKETE